MKLPFLPLYIDQFNNSEHIPNAIYLLSHFHTDHMKGLSPLWCAGTIICDEVTRALVIQKYGTALTRHLKSQPLFQSTVLFKTAAPLLGAETSDDGMQTVWRVSNGSSSSEEGSVNLYLLPAFHIPGSVMFFLETPFGNILYTGDFKYDEYARDRLNPFFERHCVDHLYVDDTWLHLGVQEVYISEKGGTNTRVSSHMLSTRELGEAIEALGRRMDQRVRDFAHKTGQRSGGAYVLRVYLHNHFGKEHIVQRLASRLGVTVFLDEGRYERMRLLASLNAAIADVDKTFCVELERFAPGTRGDNGTYPRIEVVSSLQQISPEELRTAAAQSGDTPHYGIMMSGWARMRRRDDDGDTGSVWVIPTTLHCTPQQVIDFVAMLRPMSVTPLHYKPCRATVVLERLGPYLRRPYVNQFLSVSENMRVEANQRMGCVFPPPVSGGGAELLQRPCETVQRGFCIAPPAALCGGGSISRNIFASSTLAWPREREIERKRSRDMCSSSPVRSATPADKSFTLPTLSLSQMTDFLGL